MKVLKLIIAVLSIAATVHASDYFLDTKNDSISDKKSTKKFHKVDLDRDEMIRDGKGSKYEPTTLDPIMSTTEAVPVTSETSSSSTRTTEVPKVTTDSHKDTTTISTSTSKVKSTTSKVPFDDITTTEKVKTTTNKSSNDHPSHVAHLIKWILGGLFLAIFVVVLSLYLVKFYRNRTESSYHHL